jgi:hypothetical protein
MKFISLITLIIISILLNETTSASEPFVHRIRRVAETKEASKADKKDNDNDKVASDDTITDANLVDCSVDHCTLVHKFVIPDNNSLNCHDVLLPIKYKVNNTTKHGFIKEGSNRIFEKQSFSANCKKIKRY